MNTEHAQLHTLVHLGVQFSCSKLHTRFASVVLSASVIKLFRQC